MIKVKRLDKTTEYGSNCRKKGLYKELKSISRIGAALAALIALLSCSSGKTAALAAFDKGVSAYEACDMESAKRELAESLRLDGGLYEQAKKYLDAISEYEKLYLQGVEAYEKGDYNAAASAFLGVKDYLNSSEYLARIDGLSGAYERACALYDGGDYLAAREAFSRLGAYESSEAYIENIDAMIALYNDGVVLMNRSSYLDAIRAFKAINTRFLDSEALIAECEKKLQNETVKLGEYIRSYNAEYDGEVRITSGSADILFNMRDSRGVLFSGAMDESGIVRYISFYVTDEVQSRLGEQGTQSAFAHCIRALNPELMEYEEILEKLPLFFTGEGGSYGCMRVHAGGSGYDGTVLTAEFVGEAN